MGKKTGGNGRKGVFVSHPPRGFQFLGVGVQSEVVDALRKMMGNLPR